MSRLPLPREYILASIKYIDAKLEKLPDCYVVNRGKIEKIRTRNPRHEYSICSDRGQVLMSCLIERQRLIKIKQQLINEWERVYSERIDTSNISINNNISIAGFDLWSSLSGKSNSYEKTESLYHNGIQVRSRMEMGIGEMLDNLGLDYVYEPEIEINNKRLSPDFVIHIPTFNCCIILEFLGMLDDYNYLDNAKLKIGVYLNNGYFPENNLILLCGNKNTAPSFDSIYNSIVVCLSNLSTMFVKVTDLVTGKPFW